MKLYIPKLKEELKLTSDWEFTLKRESRNDLFPFNTNKNSIDFILPKDTILKVDRYYIRNGASDYDSMTFRISDCPIKDYIKKRFWVNLEDANKIEFETTVFNKFISLIWDGYLHKVYPQIGLIEKYTINNIIDINRPLECNINDKLRFKISQDIFVCDPTEENWLKFNFNLHTFIQYGSASTFSSLNSYFNKHIKTIQFYSRCNLNDFLLVKSKYILTDFKTNKEYESESVNTLKEKARKILKEEIKN